MQACSRVLLAVLASVLVGCGGGGSSSGTTSGGSVTPPPTAPSLDFPAVNPNGAFPELALTAPITPLIKTGFHSGRVMVASSVGSIAGAPLEVIDFTDDTKPKVLASTTLSSDGSFQVAQSVPMPASTALMLRTKLANGVELRAFAGEWTEISAGSEVAVREVRRLLAAGAFADRAVTLPELQTLQRAASLLWQANFSDLDTVSAVAALTQTLRFQEAWNRVLNGFGKSIPDTGYWDVLEFAPAGVGTFSATVSAQSGAIPVAVEGRYYCLDGGITRSLNERSCGLTLSDGSNSYGDPMAVVPEGLVFGLRAPTAISDLLTRALQLANLSRLASIELPYQVGSKVLLAHNPFVSPYDNNTRATVKVTRTTYPMASVEALGGRVQAIQMVLDYDISTLDKSAGVQTDYLFRDSRWFVPNKGLVKIERRQVSKTGNTTQDKTEIVTLSSITGQSKWPVSVPHPAPIRLQASSNLLVRHVAYSKARDVAYVAVAQDGGKILEISTHDLGVLRTISLGSAPQRLAISGDGSRLYVGMEGGRIRQYLVSDLSLQLNVSLPSYESGAKVYENVIDMDVDPFNPERLVVLARNTAQNQTYAILTNGTWTVPAGFSCANGGYCGYSPTQVAWTAVRDEFTLGSRMVPASLYRFKVMNGGFTEIASRLRSDDYGYKEVGGTIVTDRGAILDGRTLSVTGGLSVSDFLTRNCLRRSSSSIWCIPYSNITFGYASTSVYYFLDMDPVSGTFNNAYDATVISPAVQCTGYTSLGTQFVLPTYGDQFPATFLGDKKLLLTTPTGSSDYCGLQLWVIK